MTRQKVAADITTPWLRALDFQEAFLRALTPDDVEVISRTVVQMAKSGDLMAASLVLDKVLGTKGIIDWQERQTVSKRSIKPRHAG